MRVLLAEDDALLAGYLARGLAADGHQVCTVGDGVSVLDACAESAPDLVILDAQMPKLGGLDVLRMLRSGGAEYPVLVITAGADPEQRLAALELGADECVAKPISLAELKARARALLRRSAPGGLAPVMQMGALRMERMTRQAFWAAQLIELSNREYAVLEQLLTAGGGAVSRAALRERVWGQTVETAGTAGTNVVDVYVGYVRRKLCRAGAPAGVIEAVRGQGYRIGAAGEAVAVPVWAAEIASGQLAVAAG